LNSLHRLLAIFFGLTLLAGCGGGGGSDASQPPPVNAVITSANAPAVAGEAADSVLATAEVDDLLGLGGGFTVSSKSSPLGTDFLKSTIERGVFQAAIGPETVPCTAGGSITISGELADPMTLSAGDFISTVFDNCDEGQGVVIDGSFEFSVDAFSGDLASGLFSLTVTLTVSNFAVTDDGDLESVDGAVTLTLDTTAAPQNSATLSGNTLTVSDGSGTGTLSNFSTTVSQNDGVVPAALTFESSATMSSSEFEGAVSYTTPVPFQASEGEYPFAGELLVTGANGAAIRLIALDNVNCRLEVDLDGDGAFDETVDTTWDEITS